MCVSGIAVGAIQDNSGLNREDAVEITRVWLTVIRATVRLSEKK